jgi:AcrR family transcriptional regulator
VTRWHTGDMDVPRGCGPPGLRERKKARTHEAIVDAALDLFERKGYEATTVEDIAAAADVSPRTFFRYFDSKQDVVLAKNHDKSAGIGALVAARPPEESPVQAIRAVFTEQLAAMLGNPGDPAVRELKVVMGTPELRAMALDHFHENMEQLAGAVSLRLGASGDSLAPRLLAGVIGTALWAIVDHWVAEGADQERLPVLVDEAFTLIGSGFDTVLGHSGEPAGAPSPRPAPAPVAAAD